MKEGGDQKIKICHIVSWYPSSASPNEAIWTKRHIDALQKHADNFVFHVQVRKGKFKRNFEHISAHEKRCELYIPTEKWFIKEIFTTLLLLYVILFKTKRIKPDFYNFQITYPLLTYSKLIQLVARKPIIVTEHWSAYHNNFGVEKKPKRIQKIFKNKRLRFLTVSDALGKDIEAFAETNINYKVAPNIVNTSIFRENKEYKRTNRYVMVSYWKYPKNPFVIFDAISDLKIKNDFNLMVIGDGPQIDEMKRYVHQLNLAHQITFTGRRDSKFIATTLQSASYLIHCSEYETASVVCMEALCCGTPIIASDVGGISEYTHTKNSITISNNSLDNWTHGIAKSLDSKWNNSEIALEANSKWNADTVGEKYFKAILNG